MTVRAEDRITLTRVDDGYSPYVDSDTGTWWVWDEQSGEYQDTDIIAEGQQGPGGTSIVWQGSFATAPSSPQDGWAYYNTTSKKSFVYQDETWYQMTSDGAPGQAGKSVTWMGSSSSPPANPQLNWAYHDTDNGITYIYDGSAWEPMVYNGSDGAPGATGAQGPQGPQGSQGATGASVVTLVSREGKDESWWATYGAIGHPESWSETATIRRGCRSGDLFLVVGTSTAGNAHQYVYQCDNNSGDLHGICIAWTYAKKGKTAYESAVSGGYSGTETQFNTDLKEVSNKAPKSHFDYVNGVASVISDASGFRTDFDGMSMSIKKGGTEVAKFAENLIELGKNNPTAAIALCGGMLSIVGNNTPSSPDYGLDLSTVKAPLELNCQDNSESNLKTSHLKLSQAICTLAAFFGAESAHMTLGLGEDQENVSSFFDVEADAVKLDSANVTASGNLNVSGNLKLKNHNSEVGFVEPRNGGTDWKSNVPVTDTTWQELGNITLPAGVWVVTCRCRFTPEVSGDHTTYVNLATTSGDGSVHDSKAGFATRANQHNFTTIVQSTGQTYYLNGRSYQAGTWNRTTAAAQQIRAVRIQ